MKVIFYLLIVVIIAYCLILNLYKTETFFSEEPESPTSISVVYNSQKNELKLSWTKPISLESITGYIIMIKNILQTPQEPGLIMKFYNNADCETCDYVIKDLDLDAGSTYQVAIMAMNKYGTSAPGLGNRPFVTPIIPTTPPTPTPTLMETPSPTGASTLETIMEEDRIRDGATNRQVYLDQELANMTSRANGIYEVNSSALAYPDNYLDDVKQSIKTLNDSVKKDLQEYRLNVHLAAVTTSTNSPTSSTPSTTSSTPSSTPSST